MLDKLNHLEKQALAELEKVHEANALQAWKVKYLAALLSWPKSHAT